MALESEYRGFGLGGVDPSGLGSSKKLSLVFVWGVREGGCR